MSEWRDYAEDKPESYGAYEWRVPNRKLPDMLVISLARFGLYGYSRHEAPAFAGWDGYKIIIPPGTQWRPSSDDVELRQHQQRLIGIDGLEFMPCLYCDKTPQLKGCRRAKDGGIFITSDAHEYNSWWLECCAWGRTPHLSDPRQIEETRRKALAKARGEVE